MAFRAICKGRRLGESAPAHCSIVRRELPLLDRLKLDRDFRRVADQDTARLESDVPGESEILAGDDGLSRDTDDLGAEWSLAHAVDRRVELDFLRDATDREISIDGEVLFALLLD